MRKPLKNSTLANRLTSNTPKKHQNAQYPIHSKDILPLSLSESRYRTSVITGTSTASTSSSIKKKPRKKETPSKVSAAEQLRAIFTSSPHILTPRTSFIIETSTPQKFGSRSHLAVSRSRKERLTPYIPRSRNRNKSRSGRVTKDPYVPTFDDFETLNIPIADQEVVKNIENSINRLSLTKLDVENEPIEIGLPSEYTFENNKETIASESMENGESFKKILKVKIIKELEEPNMKNTALETNNQPATQGTNINLYIERSYAKSTGPVIPTPKLRHSSENHYFPESKEAIIQEEVKNSESVLAAEQTSTVAKNSNSQPIPPLQKIDSSNDFTNSSKGYSNKSVLQESSIIEGSQMNNEPSADMEVNGIRSLQFPVNEVSERVDMSTETIQYVGTTEADPKSDNRMSCGPITYETTPELMTESDYLLILSEKNTSCVERFQAMTFKDRILFSNTPNQTTSNQRKNESHKSLSDSSMNQLSGKPLQDISTPPLDQATDSQNVMSSQDMLEDSVILGNDEECTRMREEDKSIYQKESSTLHKNYITVITNQPNQSIQIPVTPMRNHSMYDDVGVSHTENSVSADINLKTIDPNNEHNNSSFGEQAHNATFQSILWSEKIPSRRVSDIQRELRSRRSIKRPLFRMHEPLKKVPC
ncbi:uncharacterized protein J8A68_002769 [[Candida] subhashii]|uniref:Uncharacterized protein n=1 Tax=[Candida] subhashii TaxID=561895 RepID=A0A8J5QIN1_9ASCO|nr:uncharacterized protein J8A68_002769 [[Candida] subhashii]KAG7663717.1 hypothetical protein J8A68_002769 [[Candida] subhashii]